MIEILKHKYDRIRRSGNICYFTETLRVFSGSVLIFIKNVWLTNLHIYIKV